MSATANLCRRPLPSHAHPDPLLLWTIDKLEQSRVMLRTIREEDTLLFTKIEEAIEIGYEVAYSNAALVDETLMEQAVQNLISNALKYSPPSASISVGERIAEEVLIRVRDRGVGIPADELGSLFQRFPRPDRGHRLERLGELLLYLAPAGTKPCLRSAQRSAAPGAALLSRRWQLSPSSLPCSILEPALSYQWFSQPCSPLH